MNSNTNISVLSQDLFRLLEMEALDSLEQEAFLGDFLNTVSRYFFQEKLGTLLTSKEKGALADKYEDLDQENLNELLSELNDKIDNVEDLYTEALAEVKSRVVKDFYTDKVKMLEELVSKEADSTVKQNLQENLDKCNKKLVFALSGRYDQIVNI